MIGSEILRLHVAYCRAIFLEVIFVVLIPLKILWVCIAVHIINISTIVERIFPDALHSRWDDDCLQP